MMYIFIGRVVQNRDALARCRCASVISRFMQGFTTLYCACCADYSFGNALRHGADSNAGSLEGKLVAK